ncbi:hypothetical protein KIPB_005037, partial [Kipferlia bialata]
LNCNPDLECPSPSMSPSSFLLCSDAGCDSACTEGPSQPGCDEFIVIQGCGPYFLEAPPCELFSLTGTAVEEGTSDGIPGVLVTAYPPASLTPLASSLTDPVGVYTLDLTEYAGMYDALRVEYEREDYVSRTLEVPVPTCGTVDLDTELVPLTCDATLCVTTLDECGLPISGATVSLTTCVAEVEVDTAVTDETGEACFPLYAILPPTQVTVAVSADGYLPSVPTPVEIRQCGGNTLSLEMVCADTPSLRVAVTTAEPYAAAAPGATVTYTTVGMEYSDSAVTDIRGVAFFSPIPPEVIGLGVTLGVTGIEGYLAYSDGITYTIPCCGHLTVPQVVPCTSQSVCVSVSEDCDAEGPLYIGGLVISYYTPDSPPVLLGTTVTTDTVESTCLDILPDILPVPLTSVLTEFTFDGTEYKDTIELACIDRQEACLEVTCWHVISGTVTGETGESVPGVDVSINTDPALSATTDVNGFYEILGLLEGVYTLTFTPPALSELAETTLEGVDIPTCGCIVVDETLPCEVPPSLCVTFTDPCANPAVSVPVTVYTSGTDVTGVTNQAGEVCFEGLETGDAVVVWTSDLYNCGSHTIDLGCGPNDASVYLTCRDPLSLTVAVATAPPFLDAVAYATVTWTTVDTLETGMGQTDIYGRVIFSNLPPGVSEKAFTLEVSGIPDHQDYSPAAVYQFPCCADLSLSVVVPCTEQSLCVVVSEDCKSGQATLYAIDIEVVLFSDQDTVIANILSSTTQPVCEPIFPNNLVPGLPVQDTVILNYTFQGVEDQQLVTLGCGESFTCIAVCPCETFISGTVTDLAADPVSGVEVTIGGEVIDATAADGTYAGVVPREMADQLIDVTYTPQGVNLDPVTLAVVPVACECNVVNPELPCAAIVGDTVCLTLTEPAQCGGAGAEGIDVTMHSLDGLRLEATDVNGQVCLNSWPVPLNAWSAQWGETDGFSAGVVALDSIGCGPDTLSYQLDCVEPPSLSVRVTFDDPFCGPVEGALVVWEDDVLMEGSVRTNAEGVATFEGFGNVPGTGMHYLLDIQDVTGYLDMGSTDGFGPFPCCGQEEISLSLPCSSQEVCFTVSPDCGGGPLIGAVPVEFYDAAGALINSGTSLDSGEVCVDIYAP